MDEAAASDFAAQLAALNAQFSAQLSSTLDDMDQQVRGQGPDLPHAVLAELHAKLHKLAGAGGTFGFPALSTQASALEVRAKTWLDQSVPAPAADWQAWCAGLQALRQTLTPSTANSGQVPVSRAPPALGKRTNVRIVLIEDDAEQGHEISHGLSQFGYTVEHYTAFEPAQAAILADPPDVLVVDIHLAGSPPINGTAVIPALFARLGHGLPLIFLTARTDFSARISAAQAGAGAFLCKPVPGPRLAESIELLLRENEQAPYRVLIVDDDDVLAEHYRLTLAAAGLLAEKVCQPENVLEAMQQLRPDLLLLDLYMPGCTGADLARAIRYSDDWLGIPIAFLSAESDIDQQIKAMSHGADDFLVKPITDARLVACVRARAARARKVAELMSQDSLTGLLKHASIKDRLTQEVDRAKRQGKVMSVAMIDIDFFKRVNDTWGHPAGDQVIKTLGHLLRQRLRRQDSIGRYGGEEFLVILPECSTADARQLLDDIRLRFAELGFVHLGQSFAVTLSAGIAASDQFPSTAELLGAADAAMYAAKHGGRNQVQLAQGPAAQAGSETTATSTSLHAT
jgi:diguanylate cyclase (GGDEF)-like protein